MKAIVHHRYGGPEVLELREIDRPIATEGRVVVRVEAAAANPLDWHIMRGRPVFVRLMAGLRRPKRPVLGVDMAGRIEEVGDDVTTWQPGDEVYGEVSGAFAEYARARADAIVAKPANATFAQAAAVPVAGFTALQALRDRAVIRPGDRVLVNGASGGVGTFAVQIAKAFGAEVTGVCSTRNVELVRSLGADHVVDYTQEDFTKSGSRYDVMLDAVGNRSLRTCKRLLRPGGRYVAVAGSLRRTARLALFGGKRMTSMLARANAADLAALKDLIDDGKVTPVIDRTYPLAEVPEAIAYLEEGHARGKVVIET